MLLLLPTGVAAAAAAAAAAVLSAPRSTPLCSMTRATTLYLLRALPAEQAAIDALGLGLPQGWSHLCAYGVFVQYQWRVHGVLSEYMHKTLANALCAMSTGQLDLEHGSSLVPKKPVLEDRISHFKAGDKQ
jgi:hypothetical protein